MSMNLLTPDEIREIESAFADGISSKEVIDIFLSREVRLSEATFRRYVQLGLLPGCLRRVGQKGKHKGSRGVYPVTVVRRVNLLKKMMSEGMTLEEIQDSFVAFRNDLDALQEAIDTVFREFSSKLEARDLLPERRKTLHQEFRETRRTATALVRRLERIGSAIAASPTSMEASP
ncbi:MAG: MerR family transcriptional regulator [Deltaproteobacteria bacterium]|nr:MerR family transcriptional regulator [Deltaproteobacteria bacterium]